MASLVVPSAVLVRLIWAFAGAPYAVNVLGGRKVTATTIDQGVANQIGAGVKAAFTSSGLNSRIGGNISLATVGVRDISAPNRPEFMDAGAPVSGASGGNLLPPQVALCATLRTNQAGKSFRGRYYQGGFDVSANDPQGTASAVMMTALVDFLEACQSTFTAAGINMAVVSRKLLTTTDVTLVQVRDNVWDTIRNRATAGI